MTASTTATTERTPVFNRSFRELAQSVAAGDASGGAIPILLSVPLGSGNLRDGVTFADMVDQPLWETLYTEIRSGAVAAGPLPDLGEIYARAAGDGVIAIALLNMAYKRPSRRLSAAL